MNILKDDPYQLNPLIEYLSQIDPNDTQSIYEISVRLPEIVQKKYIKYGNAIGSADELIDKIHTLCQLIERSSNNYSQGIDRCKKRLETIIYPPRKKNIQVGLESEETMVIEEMRWLTVSQLMQKISI